MDYIPMNKRIPILVGISNNINDKITNKAKDAGFNKVL